MASSLSVCKLPLFNMSQRSLIQLYTKMAASLSPCNKLPQPIAELTIPQQPRRHDKAVVVMGATGTGKSRLAIDLATHFSGEIINSDKIQVYKGLDVITNKVTDEERRRVPHHLLGTVDDPDEDFTAEDFVHQASLVAGAVTGRGRLPIIAGGSNSFVEALVIGDELFRSRYECCFLWVDVSAAVLHAYVEKRVDKMVEGGLVEEVAGIFDREGGGGDYNRGIRRAIGVPELHDFFMNESLVNNGEARVKLLEAAIDRIKANTCDLTCRQVAKITWVKEQLGRRIHRLDATEVFLRRGVEAEEAWDRVVLGPSIKILDRFLCGEDEIDHSESTHLQ